MPSSNRGHRNSPLFGALVVLVAAPAGCKQNGEEKGETVALAAGAALPEKSKQSCLSCEKADPGCSTLINGCGTLQGSAKEGPKSGISKKELCQAVVACVERTNCAKEHVSHCYCGDTQGTECLEGKARGACKTELEAALESADPGQVARRFDTAEYAGAMAMFRYQCQHEKCKSQCF